MFHPQYYIYLIPMLLSAILSLVVFRKKWPQPYPVFSIALICNLSVELFALLWNLYLHNTRWWHFTPGNLWCYNFYLLPQYLFYLYFFYKVIRNKKIKKNILLFSGFFTLFALANYFLLQKAHQTNSYTMIAGYIAVIVLCIHFFNQTSSEKEAVELAKSPAIWISSGLLLFNLCSLPCFIFTNYLNIKNPALSLSLFYVVQVLNIITYSFYSIAFLCKPHFQK
jgi:hypothetical protein